MAINKSLLTNLVSVGLVAVGYAIPTGHYLADPIRQIGLYATSGAITNWLAIYMLFEKVPGLYGSGVVPSRFEEFKEGIRHLMMSQFFTKENVESFLGSHGTQPLKLDAEPLLEIIDYDAMFEKLVNAVLSSSFGGMLGMFGGPKALEPLRVPFQANIREEIQILVASPKLLKAIQDGMNLSDHTAEILEKVDAIVQGRLAELTPNQVKQIVEEMIHEHLGWLVVWGGVLGGLIGLVASWWL